MLMKWHDDNPSAYDIPVPSSRSIYHDNIEIVKTEFKKKKFTTIAKERIYNFTLTYLMSIR